MVLCGLYMSAVQHLYKIVTLCLCGQSMTLQTKTRFTLYLLAFSWFNCVNREMKID